jgi:branched-chain amino acid transport system ATP-binding protein
MSAPAGAAVLDIRNVETFYGAVMALRGVSLEVRKGAIVTILGANGAGKTTLLKTVSGVMEPEKGEILLDGENVAGMDPDAIVKRGVAHVPEGREVFPFLEVEENLRMGAYTRRDGGIARDLDMVYGYFPILKERRRQQAGYLSGGQQQMLAIGRGLMARPKILLLDEPSLGLSPILVREIFGIVRRLNQEQGVTMMLVEQNARVALDTAHFAYVMELGRLVMSGPSAQLKESEDIREFYLGQHGATQRGERRWKRRKTWR